MLSARSGSKMFDSMSHIYCQLLLQPREELQSKNKIKLKEVTLYEVTSLLSILNPSIQSNRYKINRYSTIKQIYDHTYVILSLTVVGTVFNRRPP